jgi:hypothetical protein
MTSANSPKVISRSGMDSSRSRGPMMALTRPKMAATPIRANGPPSISTDGTNAAVMAMATAVHTQTMTTCFNIGVSHHSTS